MPKKLVLPGQKSTHICLKSQWIEQSLSHLKEAVLSLLYCIASRKKRNISPEKVIEVIPSAHETIVKLLILNILTSLETTAIVEQKTNN